MSVICALFTALAHFWEQVAPRVVLQATGQQHPQRGMRLTYECTDFDEHTTWVMLCNPRAATIECPCLPS